MPHGSVQPIPNASKLAVALLLTFVAGSVDVIGYLTLHHVFTAHVSGTTAHLGMDISSRRWDEAAIAASVAAAFVFGSVIGRVTIEIGTQIRFRRVASITLGIEAALLVIFVLGASNQASHAPNVWRTCWLLGLLGCAMGLQTATLTRVGPLTVHTTFVTGMLNKLAQLVSHLLFESYQLRRAENDRKVHLRALRRRSGAQAAFISGIWILYFLGAVTGTLFDRRIGLQSLYLGVAMLACAIAVDGIRPLSIEEEEDQSER